MVIDTSALVAILLGEAETEAFLQAIAAAPTRLLSSASYVETAIVMLGRSGPAARDIVERLIAELAISIMPVTAADARAAIDAYQRYGRISRHPAALNYGDCFSYALAKLTDEPLLFKGDDFSRTDIPNAIADPASPG